MSSAADFVADTLELFRAGPAGEVHGMPAPVFDMVLAHRAAIAAYLGRGPRAEPKVRIPKLTLQNVPRFIPAIARALERGQIGSKEANAMLYAAQMLVTAYRALGDADDTVPPAKRIGFIQAAAAAISREVPACQQH